jgi:hypothetical protein
VLPVWKEYYEDDKQLVMILEMMKGGEVLEHLKTITKYSEKAAAALFRQQLSALAHLHTRSVATQQHAQLGCPPAVDILTRSAHPVVSHHLQIGTCRTKPSGGCLFKCGLAHQTVWRAHIGDAAVAGAAIVTEKACCNLKVWKNKWCIISCLRSDHIAKCVILNMINVLLQENS